MIDVSLGKTVEFLEYDYICKEINSDVEISENPDVEYID